MADSFNGSDESFNTAVNAFGVWLAAHFASIGLTAGENTAIQAGLTDWNTKYAAASAANTAAGLANYGKDTCRDGLTGMMRPAAKKVTNQGDRGAAGLNVYAERRGSVPTPTTKPILMVDTSQRFVHILKFVDEATPNSKAKPDGVRHLEIWWYIGANPPTGHDECTYLATDTNTPYNNNIDSEHVGKMVHYMARWVNSRNEAGPWSETVSATVTG